jgi:hypothetical protein
VFLGIDHGRQTYPLWGLGTANWCEEKGKGVISRIEAFEAFRADGVALGLYLRVAISATDLRDERYLGGGAHGGI